MLSPAIKKETSETVSLSLPLIGSWLIYSMSGFIGTAMVARLGDDALAASVLTNTLWLFISVFFYGIFNSVSVTVSHQYGARNYQAVSEFLGQAFLLAAIIMIPIFLSVMCVPTILRLTSQDAAVMNMAISYAHALLWSVPGVILLIVFENFLNGIGMTRISLWISLLEVPIEIFLIYIFVYGKFGLPAFGVAGVGYGLAASYSLTTLVLIFYLKNAAFAKPLKLFSNIFRIDSAKLWELISIGFPVGFMYLIEVGAMTAATFMIARFSLIVLAAQQVVMQYLMLTINASFAVAQAVSIRIGQNMGRNDPQAVRYSCYAGYVLSFGAMAIVAILYMFFPSLLLRIDMDIYSPDNQDLLYESTKLMFWLGIYQLFDGVRVIQAGALRGLKQTRFPMYASIISFWLIALPCAYLFGFVFNMQAIGIWWGLILGVAVGVVILFYQLRKSLRMTSASKPATITA